MIELQTGGTGFAGRDGDKVQSSKYAQVRGSFENYLSAVRSERSASPWFELCMRCLLCAYCLEMAADALGDCIALLVS